METLEEYEKICDRITQKNEEYLKEFEDSLIASGLSEKTIKRHENNAEFYIDTYLLRVGPSNMEEGCDKLDDFFGYFFIRKCMWSTPANIKTTAASLKKFYKLMLEHGHIKQENYQELLDAIEYNMEDWQETCKQYNDPQSENPYLRYL